MNYLVKVYQFKKGTTRKPSKVNDVLLEGRSLGVNETCLTQTLKGATQERTQAFIRAWLDSPLGLSKATHKRLQERCEQFINSGVHDILFVEDFTKKKNRIEIFIMGGYDG